MKDPDKQGGITYISYLMKLSHMLMNGNNKNSILISRSNCIQQVRLELSKCRTFGSEMLLWILSRAGTLMVTFRKHRYAYLYMTKTANI